MRKILLLTLMSVVLGLTGASTANASAGVQAELRSSAALTPALTNGLVTATAPAGGLVVGTQPWACDANQGFAPIVTVEAGTLDPLLAVGMGGVRLPISATTVPATCGQIAYDGSGNAYITQGVVDTKATSSVARGILRETLDAQTGALVGSGTYIATTAGLDGNQPTAAAVGPDGNLYVAFLKSGNIKRIVNPGTGTTQVVQSVGNTPNGHFGRALAFAGNDLYIGSIDAFSVIHNAISPSCSGGCNATVINDGFSGIPHVGVTSDGVDTVYFAVSNQVWRYTPSTATFAFIASGGVDRNGNNASSFSFVNTKTNMLTLDQGGNLWVGDDTSNGTAIGTGRIWTIPQVKLNSITGGSATAGTNIATIQAALHGPWIQSVAAGTLTTTFNADGTFTTSITDPSGAITTDSGTWTLNPPVTLQPFANPQAQLTMTDSAGTVLIDGDLVFTTVDRMFVVNGSVNVPTIFVGQISVIPMIKFAP